MEKEYNLFSKDYLLRGIHREYSLALSDYIIDKKSGSKIFDSTIDLIMASVLVGCIQNKRSKPQKGESRRIMTEQFQSHYYDLMFIFHTVMLTNNYVENAEQRINNSFRNKNEKENWELFEEYMLGGLETLYNIFFPENDSMAKSNYDDYFDRLQTMLSDFNENDIKEENILNPFN